MKKVILVLAFLMASCSSDSDALIPDQEVAMKDITLNLDVLIASESSPIMQRRSTCDFPELYHHKISNTFNVYFIPTQGGESFTFTDVNEGKSTFSIPEIEYRVVVTNSDKKYRGELPITADVLYLFGESTVDFKMVDTVDVAVTNDYASIMVVSNTAITHVPVFAGVPLSLTGEYYNIYVRSNDGPITGTLGINDYKENYEGTFTPNEVYRFMICPQGSVNIIVDSDILTRIHDQIIG